MFRKDQTKSERAWAWLTVLLLASYLCVGFLIFRDYGASSDEKNQIEAGHITWAAVCEFFGKPAPDFDNLPKPSEYYNRYYGQAATFPTVIIEAIKGFSMDVSSVLRMRHLWNFLLYFTGLICLTILTRLRFHRNDTVFFLLLIHILTPRLFGDAFYNDRDVLLISLLWISLLCFRLFLDKSNILTAILCGFFFALAINTRFFGLVLLLLPIMLLFSSGNKKPFPPLLIIISTMIFWYIFTPVFWGNFLQQLSAAFQTLASGQQRTQETGGTAQILFFGKYYRENALPFYYLPLWIIISTPIIPLILSGIGLYRSFRYNPGLMDRFMRLFLCAGISAVMLIRPVLYNGWRHLYFFYIPIFWFAGEGVNHLLNRSRKWVKPAAICSILLSAGFTTFQIIHLHPYEYIYLNPLFQTHISEFDRDYWRLSTNESLKWIWNHERDHFSVGETNESLDNSLIGLFPEVRKQTGIIQYSALHRFPPDYLIFNYSGSIGNEQQFPLYETVHTVERDEVKLSEIYQRLPALEPEIASISVNHTECTDDFMNPETEWRSETPQNPRDEIIITFNDITALQGISLLPGSDEREYARSPEIFCSIDGENWTKLPLTVSGLFDLSFPRTEVRHLRIHNTDNAEVHWSIREIYFY